MIKRMGTMMMIATTGHDDDEEDGNGDDGDIVYDNDFDTKNNRFLMILKMQWGLYFTYFLKADLSSLG